MAFRRKPKPPAPEGVVPADTTSAPAAPQRTGRPLWLVRRKLHEARWRLRGAGFVQTVVALLYGAGLIGSGLLIAYPLARDTKLGLPLLVLSAWFVAGISAAFSLWFFLFRRIPDYLAASEIERRHPELHGAFTNSVEFELWAGGRKQPPEGIAFDLAHEELLRAETLAASLRIGSLNRWKPVGQFALGALVPAAFLAALFAWNTFQAKRAFATLAAPRQAWVELKTAFQSSGETFDRARVAGVRVELHYPDYLKLPPATIEASDGSIEAIRGTRVVLDVRTLDRIRTAHMEFAEGGSALTTRADSPKPVLTVESDKAVKAEFVLGTSGSLFVYYSRPWRFGESRTQPFRITVTDDLTPRVEMAEPAGERKVKPTDEIAVRYHASDDHVLTGIQLRVTGRITDETIPLPAPEAGASSVSGDYTLNLANLDLAGEEDLEVFIEAADDDTVSGPKTGSSAKARLLLRADERELLQLLDNQERILAGMIDWLGTNLETYPKAGQPDTPRIAEDFTTLFKRAQEVVAALDETVKAMLKNPLSDENATEALVNIHKDLAKEAKKFEQTGTRFGLPGVNLSNPAGAQVMLTTSAQGQVPPLEKHILFMDTLISKQRLDEALRPREEIEALKNRIRELIEDYKKTGDKALLDQIRKLTNRLKDLVNRTLSDAARRFDELPDEFVNKTEQKKDIQEMQKLSDQLAGQEFSESMSELENYLDHLDETFGNMDLARSSFAGEAFFKDLGKLAEMEKKVAGLEKEQKEIVKEIEKQRGQDSGELFSKAEQEKLHKSLEEAVAKLDNASRLQTSQERQLYQKMQAARQKGDMQQLQKLQQEAQAQQMQRIPSRLSNAARAADSVKNELDSSNIGAALATLKALERETQNLTPKTSEKGENGEPAPRPEVQKAGKNISEAASMIEKKIGEASNRQPGGKNGQGQMDRLSERQNRARKQADELAKQLQEMASGSPMIPGDSGPEMESASSEMGESSQQIGGGRPQAALSPSASASSRLQGIRQGLSEARQRMQNGMQPGGNSPGGSSPGGRKGGRGGGKDGDGTDPFDSKVEIPKADEFRSRNKDEIIDSMKEPAPKSYNPQNRDYYKNLMQN